MRVGRSVAYIVALAAILAFGYWVWPTPYLYLPAASSPFLAVRVHRLTGVAEYLTADGWAAAGQVAPDTAGR